MTVVDAIKRAGSTDKDKLIAAMEKTAYDSPLGKITFKKSEEGGIHQAIDEQIITQWQKRSAQIVWPPKKATRKLDVPDPDWKKPVTEGS